LALVFGFCALGATGAWLGLRAAHKAVRERIVEEAKKRGFEIAFADAALEGNHVRLKGVSARPVGVRGAAATAQEVDATLSGLEWQSLLFGGADKVELVSLTGTGVNVSLLGSAPSLALELSQWTKRYPSAYDMKAEAYQVSIDWRSTDKEAPWLQAWGGTVTRSEGGGRFQAAGAKALGTDLGAVGSTWTKDTGRVALDVKLSETSSSAVHAEIQLDPKNPTASFELTPTQLKSLSGVLGMPLPHGEVTVTAKAQLKLPPGLTEAPVPGSVHVELIGYVPPHPVELDGFVFGDRTLVDTDLEVSADQKTVKLENTKVRAGTFELTGNGEIQRAADYALARLRLNGSLPCLALASAAADSRLGKNLAALTKQLLKSNLGGSVGVTVRIDADTRDLNAAKVLQSIGVGCGLKPLHLPTPEELLAFQAVLPALAGELASLPKLPSADELLGGLDKLPEPGKGSAAGTPTATPSASTSAKPETPKPGSTATPSPSTIPSTLPQLPSLPSTLPSLPTTLPPLPSKLPELPKELTPKEQPAPASSK
jgi:hypothetical protein